jgi:hypothetical protein
LFIRDWLGKLVVADRQQPEPELRMKIHKNSGTTSRNRRLMVRRMVEEKQPRQRRPSGALSSSQPFSFAHMPALGGNVRLIAGGTVFAA